MDTTQSNFTDMVGTVKKTMDDNRALWASKKPLLAAYNETAANGASLEALRLVQTTARQGVALNKKDIGNAMIAAAVETAGQLCAYAAAAGDAELLAFSDLEATNFTELEDSAMDDLALEIHKRAKALLDAHTTTPPPADKPNFTDYEVTAASLLLLNNLVAAYAAVVNSPRAATVKIGSAKEAIDALIDRQRQLFERQFDKLMKPFEKKSPEFFAAYTKSRLIVDKAATHAKKPPAKSGGA